MALGMRAMLRMFPLVTFSFLRMKILGVLSPASSAFLEKYNKINMLWRWGWAIFMPGVITSIPSKRNPAQ
jgi:hypothetical protein